MSQLGELVRAALSQATPYGVWVEGEISGISRSRNGHVYFDLTEPAETSGARPVATIPVTLFREARDRVNRLLKRHGDAVRMTDGVQVRIQGVVDFYAPSGRIQFRMSAIDPTYTLGKLVAERDLLLSKLSADGILGSNATRPIPPVPLLVGLVTSVGSAAHADILEVLEQSGFAFDVKEIDSAVQGQGAERTVVAAIGAAVDAAVDVIVIARGGGSRTDLAAFNHERIARAIAASPIPVVTGIGHEIDRSVADEVAHTFCTTPTAAGQRIVDIVTAWLDVLATTEAGIVGSSESALASADARFTSVATRLTRSARHTGELAQAHLLQVSTRVVMAQQHALRAADRRLDSAHARTRALDPSRALARGWSITRRPDGSLVRSTTDVAPGDEVTTQVADGLVTSTIDHTEPAEETS